MSMLPSGDCKQYFISRVNACVMNHVIMASQTIIILVTSVLRHHAVKVVSFHYGADHYAACQYGDSSMAQVRLGAFRYGVFQYGADLVWRCFGMAHSRMTQVQYGAFQYGAVPVWRFEASS